VEALKAEIHSHSGIRKLKKFGNNLQSRPLSSHEMCLFLASMGAFFLEVPPGILSLPSRITDEWLKIEPLKAIEKGARILFAAVDEFGLNDMDHGLLPTHHQLFIDIANHWGVSTADLADEAYILPAGAAFGHRIAEYYRERTILEGLGLHVAVETTATIEFGLFLRGFQKFSKEYKLKASGDPILNFFFIHMDVEASHREMGLEMIELYTKGQPELLAQVRAGVFAFMEAYGCLFAELNEAIYETQDNLVVC